METMRLKDAVGKRQGFSVPGSAGEIESIDSWSGFVHGEAFYPGKLAAEPGFEPGLRDPKSPVLPLHNSATNAYAERNLHANNNT